MAAADPDDSPDLPKSDKKRDIKPSDSSGLELTVDVERQCIVLPKELWLQHPDRVMRVELPFFRECMEAAFSTLRLHRKSV